MRPIRMTHGRSYVLGVSEILGVITRFGVRVFWNTGAPGRSGHAALPGRKSIFQRKWCVIRV